MAEAEALKLFFSYSHVDEALRNELGNHLKILEYQKLISSWHDRKILPGEEWDHQISSNLETADIILLLISADFIASRYCWEIEIQKAMELHKAGQACVIPVILRDVDWTSAPFGKLQALPQNAVAVTSSPNKDAAFKFVAQEIKKTATAILEKRKQERERQRKEIAIAEYRHKYLEFLADSIITPAEQFILNDIQKQQGLTDGEVAAIKAENVISTANPEALEHYRQAFLETITQFGYPLNEQARRDLKLLQEYLRLSDGDISQIEAPIITEKERERQQQEEQGNSPLPSPTVISAPPKTPPASQIVNLLRSQFETVTIQVVKKPGLFKQKIEIIKHRRPGEAEYFQENLGNGITLEMVAIPGGKFIMGTDDEEIERLVKKFNWEYFRREKPQHEVTIQPFFMGKYPIIQGQWKIIASRRDLKVKRDLDINPSRFKDFPDSDNRPVERVSWDDAIEFCARLSKLTGREYRLPSEAEWEYACRAGTTTPFYFGETITSELANYDANYTYADEAKGQYRQKTTPVGQFPPNAFGLYDMHGNVWQWCLDDWHGNYQGAPTDGSAWLSGDKSSTKVVRGGSWDYAPGTCRSASRRNDGLPVDHYGFRVLCVPPRTP